MLNELESEVYSDPESFVHPWYEQTGNAPHRVHSEDDDGYADWENTTKLMGLKKWLLNALISYIEDTKKKKIRIKKLTL